MRDGRELNVDVIEPTGAPSGRTVFLVHGGGGRAAQWRLVWPALIAAGHRVVAFDALGHGGSPSPRRWSAYAGTEFVADLRALVERHASASNLLVAHSYGTSVVLGALAAGMQAEIVGAVLLAPPAGGALTSTPWIAWLPVPLLERMRPKLSAGFRAAAWGPDAPAALVDEETAISDRNSLYVFKAMWRQRLELAPGSLAALSFRVNVIAGDADRLTPAAGAKQLAESLPNARFEVLARVGHQIPLERPEAVVGSVLGLG